MGALRERFVARARGEAKLVAVYAGNNDRTALSDLCHSLAGTAGMFGFSALGEAARKVEDAIDWNAAEERLQGLVGELLAEVGRLPQGR